MREGKRERDRGKGDAFPTMHTAVDIVLRRLLLRFHLTPCPVDSSRLSGKYLSVIRAGRMELKTVALRDVATPFAVVRVEERVYGVRTIQP